VGERLVLAVRRRALDALLERVLLEVLHHLSWFASACSYVAQSIGAMHEAGAAMW
jgi:hypothetical protein